MFKLIFDNFVFFLVVILLGWFFLVIDFVEGIIEVRFEGKFEFVNFVGYV